MKKPGQRKQHKLPGLQIAAGLISAVAAAGLLILYLFCSPEEIDSSHFLHALQITMTSLVVVAALAVVYSVVGSRKSK